MAQFRTLGPCLRGTAYPRRQEYHGLREPGRGADRDKTARMQRRARPASAPRRSVRPTAAGPASGNQSSGRRHKPGRLRLLQWLQRAEVCTLKGSRKLKTNLGGQPKRGTATAAVGNNFAVETQQKWSV